MYRTIITVEHDRSIHTYHSYNTVHKYTVMCISDTGEETLTYLSNSSPTETCISG